MPKINREEYEILKELDDKWKWIARIEWGAMKTFISKPFKNMDFGRSGSWDIKGNENHAIYTAYSDLFQFIQWEDEEPHNIAELIEEYESEETEVKKDKRWFVDKWTKERNKTDVHDPMYHFINEFIADVDQLDEPEVLSREFINEKAVEVYADTTDAEVHAVFRMRDLQNLLVPKQEEITHKQVEKYLLDKNIRVIDIDIYEEMQSELEELKDDATLSKTETVADVVTTFWKSYERLKEVMSMEVEELEE